MIILQASMAAGMILIGLGPVLFLIGTLVASIFIYGTISERFQRRSGKKLSLLPKLLFGTLSVLGSGLLVATVLWIVLSWFFDGLDS